jgi:hypothetical protein
MGHSGACTVREDETRPRLVRGKEQAGDLSAAAGFEFDFLRLHLGMFAKGDDLVPPL